MGGLLPRGPQRENLYKEFDIPLDAKRRKYAFARRLWTRKATQSYKSLWRHCELVLQLYGEEPGDRLHQAAFEAARTKAGKRSVFKRFVSRATGATQRSGA